MTVPDRMTLPAAMESAFPEYRDAIVGLISRVSEYGGFAEYSLLSDVFRWSILELAIESGDVERLRRSDEFIEALLASPDPNVRDPTEIRVVPYMLQDPTWAGLTRRWAGPLLRVALDRYTESQAWRSE